VKIDDGQFPYGTIRNYNPTLTIEANESCTIMYSFGPVSNCDQWKDPDLIFHNLKPYTSPIVVKTNDYWRLYAIATNANGDIAEYNIEFEVINNRGLDYWVDGYSLNSPPYNYGTGSLLQASAWTGVINENSDDFILWYTESDIESNPASIQVYNPNLNNGFGGIEINPEAKLYITESGILLEDKKYNIGYIVDSKTQDFVESGSLHFVQN
jgi:hypothetical protein